MGLSTPPRTPLNVYISVIISLGLLSKKELDAPKTAMLSGFKKR